MRQQNSEDNRLEVDPWAAILQIAYFIVNKFKGKALTVNGNTS